MEDFLFALVSAALTLLFVYIAARLVFAAYFITKGEYVNETFERAKELRKRHGKN